MTTTSLGCVTAEIGLGRDHQAEHLQFGRDVQLALGSVEQDLAEIGGASFGSDGPQHVGQVFRAELCGRLELVELHLDLDVALLALDLGLAA